MQIYSLKSSFLEQRSDLFDHLRQTLQANKVELKENMLLAVSSKLFSYAEDRVVSIDNEAKFAKLIETEAEIDYKGSCVNLTYKNGLLVANAGVDRSNTKPNTAILWPKNCRQSCLNLLKQIKVEFKLRDFGVLMVDSLCLPARQGVVGMAVSYAGFKGLIDKRGSQDIYGNPLEITQVNVADAVASAANLLMGEADEMRPYVVIEGVSESFQDMKFLDEAEDLAAGGEEELRIPLKDCIFNAVYKF